MTLIVGRLAEQMFAFLRLIARVQRTLGGHPVRLSSAFASPATLFVDSLPSSLIGMRITGSGVAA